MIGVSLSLGLSRKPTRPSVAAQIPLRAVATNSKVLSGKETRAGKTMTLSRYPFVLGADASSLAVLCNNWLISAAGLETIGNAITIVDMAIETTGGATAPVYFAGGRSRILADGETDVVSDEIAPASLGLSVFAKNTQFWIKVKVSVASSGQFVPYSAYLVGQFSGAQGAWYDPAVTTVSSTDAAGAYTATGTALDGRANSFNPMIVGRPVVDGPSFIVTGDSIAEGVGDSGAGVHGNGFVHRAMHVAGAAGAALYPCLNLARSGAAALPGLTKRIALYKYGRFAIEEIGTNDLGTAGTGDTAVLKAKILSLWQEFRDAGISKILRTTLIPRATSTDSYATVTNQSNAAGWSAGGKGEEMNSWFATRLADGTIDKLVAMNTIRAPEDFWKFRANGTANYTTADGTHPTAAGHEFMAEDLRAVLSTL